MAEKKAEKKTKSEKLNGFLDTNKKPLLAVLIVVIVALIGYVVFDVVSSKVTAKNLAKIEAISYELTNKSSALSTEDLTAKIKTTIDELTPYANKGGVVGVRANMLCAELKYYEKDYNAAISYWESAAKKGKKSYTTPIAYYQMGVCYEMINDFAKAADCYKNAAEVKDFKLASHAMFSYGRVLESQNNYEGAVEAYQAVYDNFEGDEWANVAKSRILTLQTQGKVN